MNTMEKTRIQITDLDCRIKTQIAEFIYMAVNNVQGKADVNEAEFKEVLDSGLRVDLFRQVKEFYNFVKDLEVDISDRDFYDLHIYMSI